MDAMITSSQVVISSELGQFLNTSTAMALREK